MKKYRIFPVIAVLATMLVGCDYNAQFEGLDESVRPSDVQKLAYELTDADYATISGIMKKMGANKADTAAADLLKKELTFAGVDDLKKFVPEFLATKYYMLDDMSEVNITYKNRGAWPSYISKVYEAELFYMQEADYDTIWGGVDSLDYFMPSKPDTLYIPMLLNKKYPEAEKGQIVYVSYKKTEVDPVAGQDTVILSAEELYVLEDTLWVKSDYEKVDLLRKADFEAMGQTAYYNFSEKIPDTLYLPQYFKTKYPYALENEVRAVAYRFYNGVETILASSEYVYDGKQWKKNVGVQNSKFVRRGTWVYDTSIRENCDQFTETVRYAEILGWTNVTLIGGEVYWSGKEWGNNGYLEASAFYAEAALEAWVILPACDIVDGMVFTFDEKHRYYKGEALHVMMSEDFVPGVDHVSNAAAVSAATWTEITDRFVINVPEKPDNSSESDFENCGNMDLTDFVDKTVHFAFKYVGDKSGVTSSVQLDNIIVAVPE